MPDILIGAAVLGAVGGWLAWATRPVVLAFTVGLKLGRKLPRRR